MNMGFCPKLVKYELTHLNNQGWFFLILLDFSCFLLIIQLLLIAECYEKTITP